MTSAAFGLCHSVFGVSGADGVGCLMQMGRIRSARHSAKAEGQQQAAIDSTVVCSIAHAELAAQLYGSCKEVTIAQPCRCRCAAVFVLAVLPNRMAIPVRPSRSAAGWWQQPALGWGVFAVKVARAPAARKGCGPKAAAGPSYLLRATRKG